MARPLQELTRLEKIKRLIGEEDTPEPQEAPPTPVPTLTRKERIQKLIAESGQPSVAPPTGVPPAPTTAPVRPTTTPTQERAPTGRVTESQVQEEELRAMGLTDEEIAREVRFSRRTPEFDLAESSPGAFLGALGQVEAVGGETTIEALAQLRKLSPMNVIRKRGDIGLEAPTLIQEGPQAALESFGARTGSFDIPFTDVTVPIEQIGVAAASPTNLFIPDPRVLPPLRPLLAALRRTRPPVASPARAPLALPPGTGRPPTGEAIPMGGAVPAPEAVPAASTRPSITVITPANPAGERLSFMGERAMRRAAEELSQRGDIEILPGTATAAEVEAAAARLRRIQPTGTQTSVPITRTGPGGTVRARPSQRQLPRGLDPENIDDLRVELRRVESEIQRTTPSPRRRPNARRQAALSRLETKATRLRRAIDDLRTPPELGLDVPGVIGREAVERVFPPDTSRALGPGNVRPSTLQRPTRPTGVRQFGQPQEPLPVGTGRQRTTGRSAVVAQEQGRVIEASSPAEAAKLRQEVRRSTASAEDITTQAAKNEPAELRIASRQPPETDPVVQKVIDAIRGAKRLGPESRATIARTRTARFAAGMRAAERAPLLGRSRAFFRRQAGDIARPDISRLQIEFAPGEYEGLIDRIHNSGRLRAGTFDPFVADEAFKKLFNVAGGTLPEPRELELLERVFGGDFVKAILSQRSLGEKAWDNFLSAWNLPRALMATGDLSATLRQAAPLAPDNKIAYARAFRAQVQAFVSESRALEMRDLIEAHPRFAQYTKRPGVRDPRQSVRLDLTQFSTGSSFAQREESFMSKWAGNLPLVKNAERAYVTMLNKLRFDVMDDMVRQAEASLGRGLDESELDHIANFINWATGRGPLGKAEAFAPLLNGMFFAPRFATSRFALPAQGLVSAVTGIPGAPFVNPALAQTNRRMARSLAMYVGSGLAILKLAELGGAEVSSNPTSSDFGKIRLGKTRIDIWGGFQQVSRLTAMMITGYTTSPTTGEVFELGSEFVPGGQISRGPQGEFIRSEGEFKGRFLPARGESLLRFLRGKLGPVSGELLDQFTGTDFLGDEASPSSFTRLSLKNPLYENVAPLFVQDLVDAILEEGLSSGLKAVPSFFGAGAVTYTADLDRLSFSTHQKRFIELSDVQKENIRKRLRREKADNRR